MRCLLALAAVCAACGSSSLPDPRIAANDYARAAEAGNADAIYAMMTTSAQHERTVDQVRAVVKDESAELKEQAKAITGKDARVEATARLRYEDGEEAALELKDGRYWV